MSLAVYVLDGLSCETAYFSRQQCQSAPCILNHICI